MYLKNKQTQNTHTHKTHKNKQTKATSQKAQTSQPTHPQKNPQQTKTNFLAGCVLWVEISVPPNVSSLK